ncbi:MAG: peptidoglycan DD-metalloendopeptidase family protein, partial [Leptolyngbya sp. Prado105]|nr:peptidoglycan DD-metalloendopeptidase family protein [Leptolyngbya sp. Prado105]
MTQRPTPIRPNRSQKRLLRRLGCLGSLGVFSSGMTLAQAAPMISPSPIVAAPSAAPEPTPPVASGAAALSTPSTPAAPVPEAVEPTPPVEIEIPESSPVSESPLVKPQPSASPTPSYQAPDAIVIEQRNPTSPKVTTAPVKPTGIGNTVSKAISGVIRPNFNQQAPEAAAAAPVETANAAPSATWSAPSIVPPSFVQNYFNRTVRPLGLPGNGDVRLLFPLSVPAAITSVFGWRIHPITGNQRLHTGTDIGAPMGTPVLAALTGRVIFADWLGGYGASIALEHTNGSQQTLYAHLSEVFVKPGDIIKQGRSTLVTTVQVREGE